MGRYDCVNVIGNRCSLYRGALSSCRVERHHDILSAFISLWKVVPEFKETNRKYSSWLKNGLESTADNLNIKPRVLFRLHSPASSSLQLLPAGILFFSSRLVICLHRCYHSASQLNCIALQKLASLYHERFPGSASI